MIGISTEGTFDDYFKVQVKGQKWRFIDAPNTRSYTQSVCNWFNLYSLQGVRVYDNYKHCKR